MGFGERVGFGVESLGYAGRSGKLSLSIKAIQAHYFVDPIVADSVEYSWFVHFIPVGLRYYVHLRPTYQSTPSSHAEPFRYNTSYVRLFFRFSLIPQLVHVGKEVGEGVYPYYSSYDSTSWNKVGQMLSTGIAVGYNLQSFDLEVEAGYNYHMGDRYKWEPRVDLSSPYLSIKVSWNLLTTEESRKRIPVFEKSKYPPFLELSLNFNDANGNGQLEADERASITGSLSNVGKGLAQDVKIRMSASPEDGITLPKVIKLGAIGPGDEKRVNLPIESTHELKKGRTDLTVAVSEHYGYDADNIVFSVTTKAFDPPKLILVQTTISDDQTGDSYGNANSRIEPGELIEATSVIQNTGTGVARNVRVSCLHESGAIRWSSESEFNLGDIRPGDSRQITYLFSVNKRYSGSDDLPIRLKSTEGKGRYGFETSAGLKLNQTVSGTTYVQVPSTSGTSKTNPTPSIEIDDVNVRIPEGKVRRRNAVAVIIGNYRYDARDLPPVPYAQSDAAIMKEYLVRSLGYEEGNIFFVENATKAGMEALFGTDSDARGRIYNHIKPGQSELFVFYSGHGAPDIESGKSYFVPSDCDPTLVRLGGYSLETFYKNLSLLATTKTWVVIDACFSGAYQEGTLIPGASPVYIELDSHERLLKNGTVFSSAKGDQVASWYPEKKHGLFTYFFLKGLQGAADADGDNAITTAEMENYVTDNVSGVPYIARRLWQREQVPVVTASDKNEILLELK
jgi:hypothetical protein